MSIPTEISRLEKEVKRIASSGIIDQSRVVRVLSDGRIELRPLGRPLYYFNSIEDYRKYKEREDKRWEELERQREIARNSPAYKRRLFQKFSYWWNKAIERMIKEEVIPQFYEIKITREAYDKANLIAKRTVHVTGANNEISFYLTNKKNLEDKGNDAIRDVYILWDQSVGTAECGYPSPEGEARTEEEIKSKGDVVIGWGHSHGSMSTFHSSIDKRNINNMIITMGRKLKLRPNPGSCFITKPAFPFYFTWSLVFNARGEEVSPAIGILYPVVDFTRGGRRLEDRYELKFYLNERPRVRIIDEKNGIEMDERVIDKEIEDRVNHSRNSVLVKEKIGLGRKTFVYRRKGKERIGVEVGREEKERIGVGISRERKESADISKLLLSKKEKERKTMELLLEEIESNELSELLKEHEKRISYLERQYQRLEEHYKDLIRVLQKRVSLIEELLFEPVEK